MCDACRESKDEMLEEIRLLAAGEGDEYESFVRVTDEIAEQTDWADEDGEPVPTEIIAREIRDAAIAQAIAMRAAFVASYCDYKTEEGKCPPSLVLGMWAGNALQIEEAKSRIEGFMAEAFGEIFRGHSNN